ncbi:MAG TPA: NADH-quinone oxidoreductase subunit M [Oligoflexia bacterium]|nr:NADH-quinone oxidoreductase subunit M [Oligoflexia bacterium]HMP47895.1 NADH-quinone oxidoreductase subunit M [Oligoflexia bacterium]
MNIELTGRSILLLLTFSPLLGIIALVLSPCSMSDSMKRVIAIISTGFTFLLSLLIWSRFKTESAASSVFPESFLLGDSIAWLPQIGLSLSVGIDGLSLWLIILTSFLSVLVMIASPSVSRNLKGYLISMLILEIGMLGTFVSLDVLLFYIFWEIMLIPMYFLIGIWGGKNRVYAAIKFVIYTAIGSLLMLVAIVYLQYSYAMQFNEMSFLLTDLQKVNLSYNEQWWLFLAFLIAFLIKVPVFPLHTWLPDAHVEAPTGGSVILAGVLLKMGIYGMVRFGVMLFPVPCLEAAPYLAILGVTGIIYGALVAWVQTDMKKLVAYSSVSHMGFCVLGFAMFNEEGMQGALLQLINHGITTAALFFLVGVLYDRKHTRDIADYGGLASKIPLFSFVFMVFMLSSIGLPFTNGFVGEFLILIGTFRGIHTILGASEAALLNSVILSLGAVIGVVLGALYMISLYRRTVFGNFDNKKNGDITDLNLREMVVFAPLLVLVFFIGLYPRFILKDLEGTTRMTLERVYSHRSISFQDAGLVNSQNVNFDNIEYDSDLDFGDMTSQVVEGFSDE